MDAGYAQIFALLGQSTKKVREKLTAKNALPAWDVYPPARKMRGN